MDSSGLLSGTDSGYDPSERHRRGAPLTQRGTRNTERHQHAGTANTLAPLTQRGTTNTEAHFAAAAQTSTASERLCWGQAKSSKIAKKLNNKNFLLTDARSFHNFLKNGLALFTTKRMPKSTKELRELPGRRSEHFKLQSFKQKYLKNSNFSGVLVSAHIGITCLSNIWGASAV